MINTKPSRSFSEGFVISVATINTLMMTKSKKPNLKNDAHLLLYLAIQI